MANERRKALNLLINLGALAGAIKAIFSLGSKKK